MTVTTTAGAVQAIIDLLKAGMTTGHTETDDYYIMTWYTGDPLGLYQILAPACAVIPVSPKSRIGQYVGEDTITETYNIKIFQPAYRAAADAAEVAAGFTKLSACLDKAMALLRTDPTFGSQFVNSEIMSVTPNVATAGDTNAFRIAEISLEIKRRALWGS